MALRVAIVLGVAASFLLITYPHPNAVGLGGKDLSEVGPRILLHPYPQHSVFIGNQQ